MIERARDLARYVLGSAGRCSCEWGVDPDTGEREDPSTECAEMATREIVGPHDERCGHYCEAHATRTREEYCVPPHRYSIRELPGREELAAAVRTAREILGNEEAR